MLVDKGISKEHREFIRLVASGESQSTAYQLSNTKKELSKGTCEVNGSKLAKKYAKEIAEAKDKAIKLVESAHNSDVVKNALNAILTQAEVDAELCKIMKKAKYDGDKLKAIDLYNKRFGSNAPVKSDVKLTDMVAPIIKKSAENSKK